MTQWSATLTAMPHRFDLLPNTGPACCFQVDAKSQQLATLKRELADLKNHHQKITGPLTKTVHDSAAAAEQAAADLVELASRLRQQLITPPA